MNRILSFSFLFLIQLFYSLKGGAQNTVLEGTLSEINNGDFVYLTAHRWQNEKEYRDSARIQNGHFRIVLNIPEGEGDIYYFSSVPVRKDRNGSIIGYPENRRRIQVIYLEQGKAEVNGSALSLDSATWSGNRLMQEENDYFEKEGSNLILKRGFREAEEAVRRNPERKGVLGSDPQDSTAMRDMVLGMYVANKTANAWVLDHPNSPFSTVLLYRYKPGFLIQDNSARDSILHLLSPAARNNKVGRFLEAWWDPDYWIPRQLLPGMKAPGFSVPDVTGKRITLESYKGHYLLLVFMFQGADSTLPGLGSLPAIYDKFKDKGLSVLGVERERDLTGGAEPDPGHEFRWPIVSSNRPGVPQMIKAYNYHPWVQAFLIDPDGIIVVQNAEGPGLEKILADRLK